MMIELPAGGRIPVTRPTAAAARQDGKVRRAIKITPRVAHVIAGEEGNIIDRQHDPQAH